MIKVVRPDSFNFDQPVATLVDVHSRGVDSCWLQKSAAVLTKELSEIRPEVGKTFMHLIALGDSEHYGANRNGDMFPKAANMKYHDTFVKHANFYRHHRNKPARGDKVYGNVKCSAYNPDMHRVELIIAIDNEAAPDTIEKIASGKDLAVSMACVTDPNYPVLTLRGYVPIADVAVGDMVLTHTGKWQEVTATNRRVYSGDVYTVHVNGLPLPLELTADHPMMAKVFSHKRELAGASTHSSSVKAAATRYFSSPEEFEAAPADWAHTEHLRPGDRLIYQPVTHVPGAAGIYSLELAAIMGYYFAEGSLAYNKDKACTVTLTCNLSDRCLSVVPQLVEDFLPGVTCTIKGKKNSKAAVTLNVYSTDLAEFLRAAIGSSAHSKVVPFGVFNGPMEAKLTFLGAVVDGDGFVDKKGVHISTCNRNAALQLRDLCAQAGMPASIYKIDHAACATSGMENSGVEYTINISWLDAVDFRGYSEKVDASKWLSDEGAPKGRSKPSSMREMFDGRYAYRVKEVTSRKVVDLQTYNIEVTEDESYTLAGMISHNCNVPFDVCSVCGNQAKKESEYCQDIKKHACEITRDGRQVGMLNTQPTFFDISEVARNADRIAFTLRKVASHGDSPELSVITATRLGITAPMELVTPGKMSKVATLRELAAIERALRREVAQDYALRKTASVFGAPLGVELHVDDKTLPAVLGVLKRADAILPMEDFFHLVMGEKFAQVAHHIPSAKAALPTIFTEMEKDAESAIFGIEAYEPLDKPVQKAIKETAEGIAKSAAVSGIFADQRVMREMLTKRSGVVPYEKCAITKSGSFLAREYAKYKVAVLDGAALSVKRMAVLQHF